MIKTILVATDASGHADAAIEFGAALAGKYDAELVLLHVVSSGGLPDSLYEAARRRLDELQAAGEWGGDVTAWPREHQVQELAGRMLLEHAQGRAEKHGAGRVRTITDWGSPVPRILEHARSLPADMIVLGARGTGTLHDLVVGSVSHGVLHQAPCTAIAVRGGEGGAGLDRLGKILVPVDGSEQADKALALAADLAARSGAKLTLVHALMRHASAIELERAIAGKTVSQATREALARAKQPGPGYPPFGDALSLPDYDASLKEVGEVVMMRAKETAARSGVDSVETRHLDGGDPARDIVELAGKEGFDLIAMGSRGLSEIERLFIGSVSYKVTHAAPCTTMLVR